MHSKEFEKSHNQLPWSSDWHRYDTPTVLRKHGRGYMERFWRNDRAKCHTARSGSAEHLATLDGGTLMIAGEPLHLRVELHLSRRDLP
ncbi:MAG: hypothetical protein EBT06_04005 [Gammaproteobacteria bacterium]|jgi:hypothetical protein|nr:hypothetical protein [Gammaproteobacteria bacterium]NBT44080.1 hypothetical protein [Gammaproteobacteria bacterium]NBY21350.1 hypothetical protein [Gammaproteobacteria bacterium]